MMGGGSMTKIRMKPEFEAGVKEKWEGAKVRRCAGGTM
jgi:hypothetical protein